MFALCSSHDTLSTPLFLTLPPPLSLSAVPLSLHGDYYSSHRLSADTQILLSSPVNHLELRERKKEKERKDERYTEKDEKIQTGLNERLRLKQQGNWGKKKRWELWIKRRNKGEGKAERKRDSVSVKCCSQSEPWCRMIIGSICCAIAEHIHISVTFIPPQKRQSRAHVHLSFSCDWAGDIQKILNDVCGCPSISVLHKLTLVSLPPACINNCQCLLWLQTGEWNCFPLDRHVSEFWIVSLCECNFASSFNAFKPHICNTCVVYCCLLRKHCYSRRKLYCLHAALS